MPCLLPGAAERAASYFKQAALHARQWYDADGNWIGTSPMPIPRERYWLCFSLYAAGETALADAIVRRAPACNPGGTESFDIFHTNIPASLLVQHDSRMANDVRRRLEERMRDGFAIEPGNRRCDFQFHGYNDNMPAKATMCLVLGGERLGNKDALDHGLWNLRQMRALLTRRGINNEFNSPTYSPLTIHAMAEIAGHARTPEAREIALKIEQRLWLDVAARFHPGTGVVAGPYSRAYTIDLLAHLSNMAVMLWVVLGDAARPSPLELFNPDSGLVLHHEGDLPFNVAQMSYFVAGAYHVPPKALELLTRKSYPFHVVATLEQGDMGPDHHATTARAETFLQPDFALGTCQLPLGNSAAYHALYKRVAEVKSFHDVGAVYHRFHINDEVPGAIQVKEDHEGRKSSGEGYIGTSNELFVLQSESTVLLVTGPPLALGGVEEELKPKPVTRLNEMMVFPSHFGGATEVRIGTRAAPEWSGEATHGEWIGCRRGRLLVAMRPLAYTADLGPVRTVLEKINNYEVVRTYFYEGPAQTFSRFELRRIFGGFLIEHASVDEYPSLAAFLEELARAQFTDQYWTTRRVRYRRPAGTKRPAVEMEISWSPNSNGARFATVNGRLPSWEPCVQIDGLKESDFPFLNEPWTSVPSHFPWPKLRAAYSKIEGAVADRE